MNGATALAGQDQPGHPTNRVLAIFDNPAQAQAAVAELNAAGFAPADIGLLRGPEDARRLEVASGGHGFFAQLASGALGLGDEEDSQVVRYRQALLDGGATLGVAAADQGVRDRIRQVLTRHGGRFVNFYGRFTVEDLGA